MVYEVNDDVPLHGPDVAATVKAPHGWEGQLCGYCAKPFVLGDNPRFTSERGFFHPQCEPKD